MSLPPVSPTDARYRVGSCAACGSRLLIHRRAGITECRCGGLTYNLTATLATERLRAEMDHPRGGIPLLVTRGGLP